MEKSISNQIFNLISEFLRQVLRPLIYEVFNEVIENKTKIPLQTHDPPMERYIDTKEVSAMFNVSEVSIWDWEKKGILKAYRIGRLKRFKLNEVLESPKAIERGIKSQQFYNNDHRA